MVFGYNNLSITSFLLGRLSDNTFRLDSILERLSTGNRFSRPSDDTGGFLLSEEFRRKKNGYKTGISNINSAISLLSIHDSALEAAQGYARQIKEYAQLARTNPSLAESYTEEANAAAEDYNNSITDAEFNGQNFLEQSGTLTVQTGGDSGDRIAIELGDIEAEGTASGTGDGTFATGTAVTVGEPGSSLRSVAQGDFDDDGHLDLVVVGNNVGSVGESGRVVFGNGDGTFSGAVDLGLAGAVLDVTVGDFDGDGVDDLAVTGPGIAQAVLSNGDRTFQSPVTSVLSVGAPPFSVEAADFDNDSDLDIAIHYEASPIAAQIYYGNGAGSFGGGYNVPTSGATGVSSSTGGIAVTSAANDFNGDNVEDIAYLTTNPGGGGPEVSLGVADGTFSAATVLDNTNEYRSVTFGVLDGDGNTDLAAAFATSGFRVYLGDGAGGFTGSFDTASSGPLESITASDLDGDGDDDIVSAGGAAMEAAVFISDGDGTFQSEVAYGPAAGGERSPVLGDFDEDGITDIVTVSATEDVYFYAGQGTGGGDYGRLMDPGSIDLTTEEGIAAAEAMADAFLTAATNGRAQIGAGLRRLESALRSTQDMELEFGAADDRIREVDFAAEITAQTREVILQNAILAMLAQANVQPRNALNLLEDSLVF